VVAAGLWHELWRASSFALGMSWEILWALVLGFLLSSVVQALVSSTRVERLLPDDSPRSLATAAGLGVASSSCSYAAVALARSLFQKGADFTAAIAFELASTNLVIELGIVITLILGWQFTAGEVVGGPLMIVLLALIFRRFLSRRLVAGARAQAERGLPGSMEGHAAMDMSVPAGAPLGERLTAVSQVYVMEWAAILRDVVLGLVIAGALAAWVPASWWRGLFLSGHPALGKLWGPVVGPVVAMLSFVCSVGNVPLAAVLWNGGISFGGVIAFVFADLIILPILDIYRRYYGARMAAFLLVTLYTAMVGAGLAVGYLFDAAGITPHGRHAKVREAAAAIGWNVTSALDVAALAVSALLVWRFFATGGGPMLRMMEAPAAGHEHGHAHDTG
jgi:hypothetical protein